MNSIKSNFTAIITTGLLLVVGCFIVPNHVHASASLFMSPAGGNYYNGSTITVNFFVSSTEAINAVELNISYDSDRLSLVSCSAVTSTFELAADSSCPSITVGTTGSYTGGGAQVATATFQAQALGNATVSVSGRAAMDGNPVATGSASHTFGISQYNPVPAAPEVISISHPDTNSWYKDKLAELSWNKESTVIGFSYVLDQQEDTVPDNTINSSGTGDNISIEADGIWYFHIKAKSAGGWSDTTHYKMQVDSVKPTFVESPSFEDIGDLQPIVRFSAKDEASGIDYYTVTIGGQESEKITKGEYRTSILEPGEYDCVVSVVDLAGNTLKKKLTVTVGMLQPPQVTELILEDIIIGTVDQRLIVRGTAPSEAKVMIKIDNESEVFEVTADTEGVWEYIYEVAFTEGEHSIQLATEVGEYSSGFSEPYYFDTTYLGVLPLTGNHPMVSALFIIGGLLFGIVIGGGMVFCIIKKKISLPKVFNRKQHTKAPFE